MRWQTVVSITIWLGAASGRIASTQLQAGLCSANTTFSDLPKNNLTGKTAIVTGGDGGLGYPITLELASRGASVIIASRNLTKSNTVARRIAALTGGDVRASVLDLSSLHSVREFVARMNGAPVHLLVNNAGIAGNPQHLTADGYQLMFQINYLGPFLLVHLLLPALRLTRGRIVNVASSEQAIACQAAGWPLDCLKDFSLLPPPVLPNRNVSIIYHDGMPNEVRPVEVYGLTKSLLIHHTAELARREPAISSFAVTPGWVNTSIIKVVDLNSTIGRRKCAQQKACPCPFSPEQGAAVIGVCALESPGPSGSYISRPDECTQGEAVAAHGFRAEMGSELYSMSMRWSNATL